MNSRFFLPMASALVLSAGPLLAEEGIKDRLLDAAHDAKDAVISAGQAVTDKTREEWRKSKGYLSDDPETYRQSAHERLAGLNADLTVLRRSAADVQGHPFFQTRVAALEQQYQEVSDELAALPPDAIRHRDEHLRQRLDDNLGRLEQYVSLAQDEERELIANP